MDTDYCFHVDLEFTVALTIRFKDNLRRERPWRIGAVQQLAHGLQPLTAKLRSLQSVHLGLVLVASVLLSTVGNIEVSNLFRHIAPPGRGARAAVTVEGLETFCGRVGSQRPPRSRVSLLS